MLRLDTASAVPFADQIAAQVRHGLVTGELRPGSRLPSARELGAMLDVNLHTVLRAYQQLRDEELLELRRGRGATIRAGAAVDRARLGELARDLLAEARRLGMTTDAVVALVRDAARTSPSSFGRTP
ncbi:transcriptional regulator, GntR family [Beutenbergia cavernae DSM 12333]|uniref:Transcriptional regulator, GntR family n=1 Tax=Beutenbergia cavernae (strain ATCC BAA-8 / DSM 12333 / CCUG 43141 / JCM 11478 / NBRC 16432 / NCIMB 13614 / HKI 0122) TaxID=471853 RepID=C5BUZ8_BEUC1|nr:GntR family transcriptional regulator [Beutenbergia cavernae]ACQ78372.1 transcriptional regulator, GntR family [Beutenbergia cavernae DSM 12333]